MSPEDAAKALAELERTKVQLYGGYFVLLFMLSAAGIGIFRLIVVGIRNELREGNKLLAIIATKLDIQQPRSTKKPPKDSE